MREVQFIVSKRLGCRHRAGRSAHCPNINNPVVPAATREAEEE